VYIEGVPPGRHVVHVAPEHSPRCYPVKHRFCDDDPQAFAVEAVATA